MKHWLLSGPAWACYVLFAIVSIAMIGNAITGARADHRFEWRTVVKVKQGMGYDEVVKVLGDPTALKTHFSSEWDWNAEWDNGSQQSYRGIVVGFRANVVCVVQTCNIEPPRRTP